MLVINLARLQHVFQGGPASRAVPQHGRGGVNRWAGGAGTQTPPVRGAAARPSIKVVVGRGEAGRGGASACARPGRAARRLPAQSGSRARCRRPRGQMKGAMELEPELLLQEARENVEAAQSYRRELGHRLEGLREARRQVRRPHPQGRCGSGGGAGAGRGQGGL